jgi:hypothetical protein
MTTAATGTCTVLARGTKGDLCDPFAEAGALHFCDPAEGLFCGSSGACEQRGDQGAACVRSVAQPEVCADGLYCGQAATCVPRKTTGEACLWYAECVSATCYRDICADTRPIPSTQSCDVLEAGVVPADAAPDGDAPDGDASGGDASDGDASDGEEG